ncbi:inositol monophosphatase family protein [Brevibacterium sp. XM4083]|uniref:inositol monophosphatase family protein n=1 Tax=Brevibacterium sp. XM4083 TaxID=2583238 RepID=UPI001128F980|nr:inositol monophosphatase family protein [Brevibacterium sp. XM4083]MCM1012948.1 inositol-phosphate phosphatase [Brevibacterium sp. XM4083]
MTASGSLPRSLSDHPLVRIAADLSIIAWEQMSQWRAVLGADLDASVVDTKSSPNDLVTAADAQIEALVRGYLRAVRPGDLMIGEEGAEAIDPVDFFDRALLGRLSLFDPGAGALVAAADLDVTDLDGGQRLEWHVDPIDGTVNFVRGIEHFAFSVGVRQSVDAIFEGADSEDTGSEGTDSEGAGPGAAVPGGEDEGWLIGLVASPGLGVTWLAGRGHGAYRVDGRLVDRLSELGDSAAAIPATRLTGEPAGLSGRLLATGFAYTEEGRAAQLAKLPELLAGYNDIRRCGSAAIDLCMVAEGKVTSYAERGLGIYDYAGGALIAEESGAAVRRGGSRGATAAADSPAELDRLLAVL